MRFLLPLFALCAAPVAAQMPLDSLYLMTQMWHDLPAAEVKAVGLAAGAERPDEVTGALTVLTARDLAPFRRADPMQVLQHVAGVNVSEEDGFGLRPNIGLRGSGSERSARITVMEDGLLAAPAPYTAPAAYYFPTIARMSSVEVMKGSSQIAFGPATSGGALNLVSTRIPTEELAGSICIETGEYRGQRAHVAVGGTASLERGDIGYLVEYLGQSSDGFKEVDGGAPSGFDKADRLVKLRWSPAGRFVQHWTLKAGDVDEVSNETYVGLSEADFAANPFRRYAGTAEDVMTAGQTQLSLTHELETARWQGTTAVYRTTFERNWYKLDRLVDSAGAVVRLPDAFEGSAFEVLRGRTTVGAERLDLKSNNRVYFAEGVQHRGVWGQPGAAVRVAYGMRAHRDGVDRFEWRDGYRMEEGQMVLTVPGTPGSAANRVDGAEALAGFVRATLRKGEWTLTPGVRHESIRMDRTTYSTADLDRLEAGTFRENRMRVWLPGVGVHRNFKAGLSAFGGVHRGFQPAGSAPGTEPERSWNSELGIRLSRRALSAQITAYHTAFQHLLGSDMAASGGTGTGDAFNGGSARAQGLEFECAWDPLVRSQGIWSLPIRASYTYTDARFTESFESDFEPWGTVTTGDRLPYLAPHTAALSATLTRATFHLDLATRYTAAMRTSPGTTPDPLATDPALLLDAGLRADLTPHLQARLSASNLLNSVYAAARRPYGLRPGPPRMLRAALTWTF